MAQIPGTTPLDRRCPQCRKAPAERHIVGSPEEVRAAVENLVRGTPLRDLDLGPCDRCQAWADVPRSFVAARGIGRWLVATLVRAVAAEAEWQWRHGIAHRLRLSVHRQPPSVVASPRTQPGAHKRGWWGTHPWPSHWLVDDVDDPEGDEDSGRVVPTPGWRQLTDGLRARGWLPPEAWQQRVAPPHDRPSHHTANDFPRRHPTEGDDDAPPLAPSPRPPGEPREWNLDGRGIFRRRPLAWGPQPLDAPPRTPDPEQFGETILRWGRDADDDNGAHTPDPGPDAPWYDRPPYVGDLDGEARHRRFWSIYARESAAAAEWEREWGALHDDFRRYEDSAEPVDAELPPPGGVDAPPPGSPSGAAPDPVGGEVAPLAGPRPAGPGDDPAGPPLAQPGPPGGFTADDIRAAKRDAARDAHPSRYRPLD